MTEHYYYPEIKMLPRGDWSRKLGVRDTRQEAEEALRKYMDNVAPEVCEMFSYRILHVTKKVLIQGTLQEVLSGSTTQAFD